MGKISRLCIAGILVATLVSGTSESRKTDSKYKVVGYVGGWGALNASSINAFSMTHVNYAFANLVNGKLVFDNEQRDASNLGQLRILKEMNPDLKILVSVGGWGWSGGFSDAALTEKSRSVFAASAVDFIKTYELDGIDLDWEYPALPGAGNIHRPEDKQNFTLLLAEVRKQFEVESRKTGKHYLLTIATGGIDEYIENTELGKAQQYLDYISIMSYDLYNGWDSTSGHHSNLYYSKSKSAKQLSTDRTVELHHQQGIPLSKLIVGVPFYGRKWKGVKSGNDFGLGQKAATGGDGINYDSIAAYLVNRAGYQRYWDSSAQVPYLWNSRKAIFISYEDEISLKNKCNYIKKKGLGGVMFWEYAADDENHSLLKVIDKELLK